MKKLMAIILTIALLASCCTAFAGEWVDDEGEKYEQLTVGVTTAFSGNFLADALGSNISDQDVRKMIHSYHLVRWDPEIGAFRSNEQVVTGGLMSEDMTSFHFSISRDLTYSDGTPITVKDYAFSFLLLTSRALKEATGLREDGSKVMGWKAYDEGQATAVSGFRLIGDYQIQITLSQEYTPYFYEMKALDIYPLPISVLAPGCEVLDDGNGVYLSGTLNAETVQKYILDPDTGYASHPSVTSGAYMMTDYDGKTVWMTKNPYYAGNWEGNKPIIDNVVVRYIPSKDLLSSLIVGDVDLTTRSIRTEQVETGMALAAMDEYALKSYSRNGLAFISFCGEKGPTSDPKVRKALAMCIDKTGLNAKYSGNQGITVDGYYGIGQWMFPTTRGQIPDAWQEENPDEIWEDFNLDGLTVYPLDVEAAKKLLDEAGWNLNADAGPWTEGLRYKNVDGMLTPLTLRLAYPTENLAGPMLQEFFAPYLREAGAELELYAVNMPDLLPIYYGQVERNYDMIMMGTNFQGVFDPSVYYDENGKDRLSGITDPQLAEMARALRQTEPGAGAEYVRRWIRYLEYRSEVLPEIPLYSNAYMDFHIAALRDYAPSAFSSWSEAIQEAYLSDFDPALEEEDDVNNEWLGEGEAEFE
jgi:ABC-type transport system substrate-binding protein